MAGDTLTAVGEVIAKVFRVKSDQIDADTTAADVNGWDSLSHTFLISAIEERFGIQFDPYVVQDFTCVGDMVAAVDRLCA